jgi:hypothetical protein
MADQLARSAESFWRWWPFFIPGLSYPLAASLLHRWLPLHYAVGVAMCLGWLVALWIINRISPLSNWSIPRWIMVSILAGTAGGFAAFLFPFF